jgi:uncharacterized OsmC-like protein
MNTLETKPTPPAKTINVRNGVDVGQLVDTMAAIRQNPKVADFTFRADNTWMTGGHNRTKVQGFFGACQEDGSRKMPFVMDNDEPAVLLGFDRGANPVEYVLHALAGCLVTSLVYHAAARGIQIDGVETHLEGDLDLHGFLGMDEAVRSGYQNVKVTMRVRGDAPEETLAELVQVAQARSPVFDIISNGSPIEVAYRA